MKAITCVDQYDPNIRWSKHAIRITLMQWDYSIDIDVESSGNCKGFTHLDFAINTYMNDHWDEDGFVTLVLKKPNGDELETTIEDEEEMRDMCVAVAIINRTEYEP